MKIAIVGGGAAGFFAAINIKDSAPEADVTIFEGSSLTLKKVEVSGGGRCNLTNSFRGVKGFERVYPRGSKLMKRIFTIFNHENAYDWFEDNGIELVTQEDNCVFPRSQSSLEIIDKFLDLSDDLGIIIKLSHKVDSISKIDDGYRIEFADQKLNAEEFDCVVVTTGGSPRIEGLNLLRNLDLEIVKPIPSLFTFNVSNPQLTDLMGTVIENAIVSIQGSKTKTDGALLITHWGVSGPAILKLSSLLAPQLYNKNYKFTLSVNWVGSSNDAKVSTELKQIIEQNSGKLVVNVRPFGLPSRLWLMILEKAKISHERRFAELGSKGINRLVNLLTNDEYEVDGKSTFKEEFVTCGGVSLDNIDFATMECLDYKNLYFAGEVLDVDAITGGFNLQAAWSMGYVVSQSIVEKIG